LPRSTSRSARLICGSSSTISTRGWVTRDRPAPAE
jgi:hypothetical protein